jgi:hypothetical protein
MDQRAMMSTEVPLTPKKSKEDNINLKINAIVSSLSHEWDLQLELPKPGDSPSKRSTQTLPQKCVFTIKFLTFKGAIDSVLNDFYSQANILYGRWVHKPKGDRGTVPEKSRHKPHPVSDKERIELQTLFYAIASLEVDQIKTQERGTPLSQRRILRSEDKHIATKRSGSPIKLPINDTPIPSKLLSSTRKPSLKRAADSAHDESKTFKRPPKPSSKPELDVISLASSSAATTSNRERETSHDRSTIKSVNTSFTSTTPSVFDISSTHGRYPSDLFSTQASEADEQNLEYSFDRFTKVSVIENHHSSEYEGGSSFDAEFMKIADSFQTATDQLDSGSVRTETDEDIFVDAVDSFLEADESKVEAKERKLRESLKGIFRKHFLALVGVFFYNILHY